MEILSFGKQVIKQQEDALRALELQLGSSFTDAINLILKSQGRLIVSGMGKSGHIGKKIAASLASTGTPSFFIHPAEAGHGDLGMITQSDLLLLLSNSGETTELTAILEYANRFGVQIIAITRNNNSTLARAASVLLELPQIPETFNAPAPTTSSTMTLVLGDAIAMTLMKLHNFTHEDFSILHPGGNLGARLKKAKEFMHIKSELPTVTQDVTVLDAVETMTQKGFGGLCVVDNGGRLVGFVSDGDVRRNINIIAPGVKITKIMSATPKFIYEDEYLARCVSIMHEYKITVLVVCNREQQPIGLLHIHDLLNAGVV